MLDISEHFKFNLGISYEADNRIRSQFDYGIRQRRGKRGLDKVELKFILDKKQLRKFKELWDYLQDGINIFGTSQEVHGIEATGAKHELRFISAYKIDTLMGTREGLYDLSVQAEVLKIGNELYSCPLMPGAIVPYKYLDKKEDYLMPCTSGLYDPYECPLKPGQIVPNHFVGTYMTELRPC